MKLKLKTAKGSKKLTRSRGESKSDSSVIGRQNFDRSLGYVGRRVSMRTAFSKARGKEITGLTEDGFLLVEGDKPGVLIFPVQWDGEDTYSREGSKGQTVYGSLTALNASKKKGYTAEIVDAKELFSRIKKFGKALNVTRKSDGKKFDVCLLNSFGDQYIAAVGIDGKRFSVFNMEHPESWNKSDVQYGDQKDADFSKVFAAVRKSAPGV